MNPGIRRPNVLFIMSDQHHAGVMGVEGRTDCPTPHLDALASQGAHYRRAYCNNAICGASRNSLQLGLYPRTLGIATFEHIGYEGALVPMQALFQQAGYATAAIGKRHLKPQADTHWNLTATTLPDGEPSDESWWDWITQQGLRDQADADWNSEFGKHHSAPMGCKVSTLPDEATMEAWTTRRTIDFIRKQHAQGKPFFAFCSFYRPHQPYTPTQRWLDTIDPSRLQLPPTLYESADALPPTLRDWRRRESNPWCLADAARDHRLYAFYIRCYLALVAEIDHHVGTLLATLDELGVADDTIIMYTADHGDFVGAHGMIEKCATGHNVYEETLRVPLIFRWPGRVSAGTRHDLAELVDLYPTLLSLAGLETPAKLSLHGRSLAPNLLERAPVGRAVAFSENGSQVTAIDADAKLGRWIEPMNPRWDYRDFGDMLFDRATDPFETRNVFSQADFADKRASLEAALDAWLARTPADAWHAAAAAQRRAKS